MKSWRSVLVCTACVAALTAFGATASAATSAPTGNAATIAFYRLVVNATARAGAEESVQSGYSALQELPNGTTNWENGLALKSGFVPATDHIVVAAAGRRVIWVSDELVPTSSCTAATTCVSVQTFLGRAGVFFRRLAPGASTCWQVAHALVPGSSPSVGGYTKIGVPSGYGLYGHFEPMRRVGNTVYVTSSFPWGKATATEVDTISSVTHLPTAGSTRVSASSGAPSFSFHWTMKWPEIAPTEPTIRVCA